MKISWSGLRRGFTLVEILIGIAVVSVLASGGYVSVSNLREGARERKLESDVTSLNAAVLSYLGNGGTLPADATADVVIAKLKTRAADEIAGRMTGMTGSSLTAGWRLNHNPMRMRKPVNSERLGMWTRNALF